MFTLRCTQKTLGRGLTETVGADVRPTALLGDWYASILIRRPQHLILCMSERTLLPVILPAKELKTLPVRLPEAVCAVLGRLGIDRDALERERNEMEIVRVGRTASRSMLGYLNDFMFRLEHALDARPGESLVEPALWLAETPCKAIEFASPAEATQALFLASVSLARMGKNAL